MTLSVVIGAARGIGFEIARELATRDPDRPLLLADIDATGVEQASERIASETGADVGFRIVDVGDEASVASLVAASTAADRVAIAAGIFRSSPAAETPRSEFDEVLRVNLVGCFQTAQGYAALMAERDGGSIVAVTSVASRSPRMRQAAYCASKAGLRQALRVLAMELAGRGVRVNTVSPGPTDTEMMRSLASDHSSVSDLSDGSLEALRPRIPDGRVAVPSDIANAVAFFLSPASTHIVMADLVVDGGELLGM